MVLVSAIEHMKAPIGSSQIKENMEGTSSKLKK